ncbi:MAG: aminoglycoside adenylyltransferase, partial [Ktedonobacteraceae bacterium]|nr:aminoglycoside adenylyltransferase [Ktedonobacteraceae bacterium]
ARVFRPLATIGYRTSDGIPYLAPEIQLLYKSRGLRSKDEADFDSTLLYLDQERRQWLAQALTIVHPGHPWLAQLETCQQ